MTGSKSLDIVGAGQIAKAIPEKAWVKLVDTACVTFRESLAPITATTSGVGRLIEAKFDRLVDAEKVLASENMSKAKAKVDDSNQKPNGMAKPTVIIAAVESSGSETDVVMRELWSNLLAKEIISGSVHPEFPKILNRLSSNDAQVLAQIAEKEKSFNPIVADLLNKLFSKFYEGLDPITKIYISSTIKNDSSFTHEHLADLNLICMRDKAWRITLTGKKFIEIVSGSLEKPAK